MRADGVLELQKYHHGIRGTWPCRQTKDHANLRRDAPTEYDPDIPVASDPEVYPPSEDSILLIESLDVSPGERVLELGCGSGVVAVHCALNGCSVAAGDINPRAVETARRTAEMNGVAMDVRETDVYSGIDGVFDTVVFNLPYLPVDEEGLLAKAWSGGPDGLGPLPALLEGAPEHLADGGRVVVVVSSLMDGHSLDSALDGWDVRVLGRQRLFFERLSVLELRRGRAPSPRRRPRSPSPSRPRP